MSLNIYENKCSRSLYGFVQMLIIVIMLSLIYELIPLERLKKSKTDAAPTHDLLDREKLGIYNLAYIILKMKTISTHYLFVNNISDHQQINHFSQMKFTNKCLKSVKGIEYLSNINTVCVDL
jgi:hypothetical protein